MSKACLFCGAEGSGALSKEHVIPQWLLEFLGLPEEDEFFQGSAETATGALVEQRIHSSFSFVDGRVCKEKCNNGWMAALENEAKPILTSLIDHSRSLRTLSGSEAVVVAKWAAKTAYLHNWAGLGETRVSRDHLRALDGDKGTLLPGVGVFAAQSAFRQPSAYVFGGVWLQAGRTDDIPAGAFKICLQFRHLYLLVAFWPNPKSVFVLAKDVHFRLFPTDQGPDVAYDGDDAIVIPPGPVGPLLAFANSLAVLHS